MELQNLIVNALKDVSFFTFFIVFFGAALLSFGSCSLIRIPIVLGYVTGVSASRRHTVISVLGFALGLIVAYTLLGTLLGIGARYIFTNIKVSIYAYSISGILLIIVGLYLLGLIPKYKPRALGCLIKKSSYSKVNFFTAFLFGFSFVFLEAPVCPCCGPLILLIASVVFLKAHIAFGIFVFFVYALGNSLPILLIGLSAGAVKFSSEKLHLFEAYIQTFAGVLLFCVGIYFLWVA